ncbi:aminoglycoside 6'-N-acetyltransferase [Fictibacillus phosphorivorans]|uniref:aminoglycoside 6'-N-acetyltransferase n=1 Tax=Fictibacillus phosphorivorans TaxID=1221500 RepID=UPI0020407A21|nr:aminoglycoside 6'-N-acetyltransferase [Fictibacillus phosphorivorans]MCM3719352.1 GNAT family N-acetyltransferase [Fictibacillus phosphorivorans]MCM3776973.1 GNAT family N-acetyltransferase [Fictibacillus phosphorivorans]
MEFIVDASEHYLDELTEMGVDLWPDNDFHELRKEFSELIHSSKDKVFLYIKDKKSLAFIHVSIRSDYVEGADSSPTGFVEGIYVSSPYRRQGISKKLLIKAEIWLKSKGCTQIGSDIEIHNKTSYLFHTQVGFKEANRLIAFIKDIS